MQYDPIKRSLGNVFNRTPFLRILFYKLIDLLLLRSWHIRKQLRQWKAQARPDANILDAGSGFGQYVFFMHRLMPQATIKAVDVKTEQVEDCNRFFGQIGASTKVKFEVADLVTFTEPEKYDLVLSVDVMEHIEPDVQVFRNLHASMRKGAMLVISTPSDQGGSDVHDEGDKSFIDEHVRDGYNIKDIEEKLKIAGFSRVEAHYSYGKPGQVSWRLSMKYPITMLNATKLFFILLPFYYLLTYPIAYILNHFDVNGTHPSGTGLVVKAWK